MQAVVLCAGKGERLRPLTETMQKAMLPLANKPLLEIIYEELKKAGIKDIIFVVGHRKEEIKSYFGKKVKFAEQKEQLGTAHAIYAARKFIKGDFLVVNGDNLVFYEDIKRVLENFNGMATLGTFFTDDISKYGYVKVESKKVLDIIEKPKIKKAGMINAGLYVFSDEIFNYIEKTEKSERGEYEITTTIKFLVDEGKVNYVELKYWRDIGYFWDYLDANREVINRTEEKIDGEIEDNVKIKGKIILEEGSVIKSGSYIEGPVCIGKDTTIGPNTYLRSYATIGNRCRIGNAVEIKNSIIMDKTNVSHLSYIGDSIIAKNCNIGAGAKVGNLRLDNKNVKVKIKGKLVDSGRRKFGCVIGENTKIGLNVMINAGRIIGCNCKIGPGVIIYRDVESNTFIKALQPLEIIKYSNKEENVESSCNKTRN